ncbi:MAG TPA: hypothetical protein RMH99_06100 [Sandaracinaceae bacterium LLY-WYZ-13_1]|nr:hypothetical protein [Sandaracinaceae bacterium LLY-WYZ-13_1]
MDELRARMLELADAGEADALAALVADRGATLRGDARASWEAGWLLMRVGRAEAGVPWMRHAAELRPDQAVMRWGLGAVLAEADRPAEAEVELLRAIALSDAHLAREELAWLYLRTDRGPEAERILREGVRLEPEDPERPRALADLLEDRGATDEAARWRERAGALRARRSARPETT